MLAAKFGVLLEESFQVAEHFVLGQLPQKRFPGDAALLGLLERLLGDFDELAAMVIRPRLVGRRDGALLLRGSNEAFKDRMQQRPALHGRNGGYLFRLLRRGDAEHVGEEVAEGTGCPGLQPSRRKDFAVGKPDMPGGRGGRREVSVPGGQRRCVSGPLHFEGTGQDGFRLGEMMGADAVAEPPPLRQPVEIVIVDVGGLRG